MKGWNPVKCDSDGRNAVIAVAEAGVVDYGWTVRAERGMRRILTRNGNMSK